MKKAKKNILKTNFYLFLLLSVGLSLTYLFVEKKQIKEIADNEKQNTLLPGKLETGELKEIVGDHLEMSKVGDAFFFKGQNIPIDQEKLNKYFYYLTKLKMKEEINLNEITIPLKNFVPDENPIIEFQFEKKKLIFKIGNKINYSQDFYIQVNDIDLKDQKNIKTRLFVVKDDAPIEGVYKEQDNEQSDFKYLRTKGLFLLPNPFFYDLHLLPVRLQGKTSTITSVVLKSYRSPKYVLDLKNKKTTPPPIGKISYINKIFNDFSKELEHARGEDLIETFEVRNLKDKLAEMKIIDDAGSTTLTLWGKYKNMTGPFVWRENEQFLIKLKKDATLVFTVPIQTFWDKTLNQNPRRLTLKENDLSKDLADFLIENSKEKPKRTLLRYKIPNLEISSSREIQSVALENLINLVTKEADYMSEMDSDDKKYNFKSMAEILVDGKKYYLKSHDSEWLAFSLEDKTIWHYSKGTHPGFTINLEEYLK